MRMRPMREPALAPVLIVLMEFGSWLDGCGGDMAFGNADDDEELCQGENVVIMSMTVDVEVLEKLAANIFSGGVEVVRVCGA